MDDHIRHLEIKENCKYPQAVKRLRNKQENIRKRKDEYIKKQIKLSQDTWT